MKYLPLNKQIFIDNRKRFMKEMKPNSIAIFVSNDEWPSNGDALHAFKQNTDLFWLSGIEQEDSMVILFPNCPDPKYREVLVLVRPNELKEKWDGKRLRTADGAAISGIQTIVWLDTIDAMLQTWIHAADTIYLDTNENDRKATAIASRDYRFVAEMKEKYPLHGYERAAKIMHKLRAIKSKEEVAVISKAIDITDETFRHLLGFILMDFGAEYGGYCADLTRTVPVSGVFTKRQKEVYNACLHLHNYAKSILKPGISIVQYTDKVGVEATKQFEKIGLLTKAAIKNQDPENPAYRKYLYHGISHHLGLDVHDLGTRTAPIQAGMVFTIEPGIYIEEEKMGIRIENNFWITKTGNIDLMKNIPITVDEIESLMKSTSAKRKK